LHWEGGAGVEFSAGDVGVADDVVDLLVFVEQEFAYLLECYELRYGVSLPVGCFSVFVGVGEYVFFGDNVGVCIVKGVAQAYELASVD